MKEKIKDGFASLAALTFLLLIGYAIYDDRIVAKSFKQRDETVITLAHIESGHLDYKLRVKLYFWYMVGNERIDDESAEISLSSRIIPRLVGNTIPIVYLKGSPKTNMLLLTEYEFKYTNLSIPDSLNWLKEYKSW